MLLLIHQAQAADHAPAFYRTLVGLCCPILSIPCQEWCGSAVRGQPEVRLEHQDCIGPQACQEDRALSFKHDQAALYAILSCPGQKASCLSFRSYFSADQLLSVQIQQCPAISAQPAAGIQHGNKSGRRTTRTPGMLHFTHGLVDA